MKKTPLLPRRPRTVIACPVTGAIHTPNMSDATPCTADDIASQAIAAADRGRRRRINQSVDAVVDFSTGVSLKTPIEDRIAPARRFSPEMYSLKTGSMNFSFHQLAKRYNTSRSDWQKYDVENSDNYMLRSTFRDIRTVAETLGPQGMRLEHQRYSVGHPYNLKFRMNCGLFRPPVVIEFIFEILGGIEPEVDNLIIIKGTAERLFGSDYFWSVLGAEANRIPLAGTASRMDGNVPGGAGGQSSDLPRSPRGVQRPARRKDPLHRQRTRFRGRRKGRRLRNAHAQERRPGRVLTRNGPRPHPGGRAVYASEVAGRARSKRASSRVFRFSADFVPQTVHHSNVVGSAGPTAKPGRMQPACHAPGLHGRVRHEGTMCPRPAAEPHFFGPAATAFPT